MNARTLRQGLVPEIGDEGQARIGRAVATVRPPGLGGDVAARYLAHAGFAEVRSDASDRPDALQHRLVEIVLAGADPAVRSVVIGASSALGEIRRAVRGES